MPKKRLPVSKIREILRLRYDAGLSERAIAASCRIARSTVADYLSRAAEAGVTWPLPEDLDEATLERLIFPRPPGRHLCRPLPDWAHTRKELARAGVTLRLLWEEYREQRPDGYAYSRYCELYAKWKATIDPVMRIPHKAGEKLFVDYAGQTVPVIDTDTGEERQAQIFVATLGASSYTYAEVTWTQSLPDWIGSHVRAFAFFGGVPRLVVPDNLKSGVTAACYYEPGINETYARMAAHYGVAVLPARVGRPRDKAKVESAVRVVETRILARLRNRRFFSLHELNLAIRELTEELNRRPFQKLDGTRRRLFEQIDRPALSPLPVQPYRYAEWKKARAGIDYHLSVEGHFYSVPFTYLGKLLDVCTSERTVEVFYREERIASHRRSYRKGGYTTVTEHMPKSHQRYAEWSPQRVIGWAAKTGASTSGLVEELLKSYRHPEHGYRASLGIMRLGKTYGPERLEAACRRALTIGAHRYHSVKSILSTGLDRMPLPEKNGSREAVAHGNIRGPEYYR